MTRFAVIALAVLITVFLYRSVKSLDPPVRRSLGRWALGAGVGVVVVLALARFGLHWAAMAGAAALALLKKLLPLAFRLFPFAARLFRARQQSRAGGSGFGGQPFGSGTNAGGGASSGNGSARSTGNGSARGARRGMSRAEALQVLGLAESASRDDVQRAYRHLIKKVHPDAPGGSNYLARQLNEARRVLLG